MPFVEQDALRNAQAKLDIAAIDQRIEEITSQQELRQILEFSIHSLKEARLALARASVARDADDQETKAARIEFSDSVSRALACYSDLRDELRAAISETRLQRRGREASLIDQTELDRRKARFQEGFQWMPSHLAKKASHMILEALIKSRAVFASEKTFELYNSNPEFPDLVDQAVLNHQKLNNELVDDRLVVTSLNEKRESFDRCHRAYKKAIETVLLFEDKLDQLTIYLFTPKKSKAIEPDDDAESIIEAAAGE